MTAPFPRVGPDIPYLLPPHETAAHVQSACWRLCYRGDLFLCKSQPVTWRPTQPRSCRSRRNDSR